MQDAHGSGTDGGREVMVPSGSGSLAGWWWAPPGTGPGPVVVMAHGFAATRHAGLRGFASRFRAAGAGVLVFDYRNWGDSPGEPREHLDLAMQRDDYRAAVHWVRSRSEVDPDRVALWGTSFSGGHVLVVAADDPRLACVVAQVPFVDGAAVPRTRPVSGTVRVGVEVVKDLLAARLGLRPVYVPVVGTPDTVAALASDTVEDQYRAILDDGADWPNRITARSLLAVPRDRPIERAGDVAAPLMVVVATKDVITPPQPARDAARLAPRGEVHELDAHHFSAYVGETHEQVVAAEVAFLARHLGLAGTSDELPRAA